MFFFFFQKRKENAFTHAVWVSAEAIPTKIETPLFPRQTMTPETALALLQGHCLWAQYAQPRRLFVLPA